LKPEYAVVDIEAAGPVPVNTGVAIVDEHPLAIENDPG
jgi:hypothetical protein